jgi:hypothetical protein
MQNIIVSFRRRFQLWEYSVGHGQLILRSTKSSDVTTTIDVLFKNVAVLHLSAIMEGLSVSEATEEDRQRMCSRVELSELEGRKIFIVSASRFIGYVIAGAVAWHEDSREYHEPSYFAMRSGKRTKEDLKPN